MPLGHALAPADAAETVLGNAVLLEVESKLGLELGYEVPVIGDKGYDCDWFQAELDGRWYRVIIPWKKNRVNGQTLNEQDSKLYKTL